MPNSNAGSHAGIDKCLHAHQGLNGSPLNNPYACHSLTLSLTGKLTVKSKQDCYIPSAVT